MKKRKSTKTIMFTVTLLLLITYSFAAAQSKTNIIDEWTTIQAPPPPELKQVSVDSKTTALLILDIQNRNCSDERRPRCVATLLNIEKLLTHARNHDIPVIFSLTSSADKSDIRPEVAPIQGEKIVKSGANKFFGTNLDDILKEKNIKSVIIVGTSAHGAVLNTATGAALRGYQVVVPVDGMSASDPYAEQYTAWHLVNGPASRRRTILTKVDLIRF